MNKTNTQRRRRLGGCSLAGALVVCCTSAFAAGTLTVPAEGMRVSTGATYDSAEINGLLVVTNCTVVATAVTVNSTAANFDAVRLEKDGIFAFEELSDATANTMPCFYFAGGRIEDRAIGKYYHTAFTTPTWMGGFKFIGVDRNQIFFNINGNPCNLGSQSTWPNVYVSGAGNFILNGSGWESSLSVGGACGKFVYSHTGDTYVKGHLTLAANGGDILPSGQGLGGFYVQEYAQVSIAATSQSVNSFQTSGEGYLTGTAGSKLSIGKNVDASVFAGVVQGSTKVVKAGAGTMTVFTATAPSFEIEEGNVVLTESLTLGADNSDSTLAMSNFLSGAGATLVKTGSGTLTLTGATEFRGSIDVRGGAVAFDESFAGAYMTPTLAIADGAKVKIADGVCLRVTSLVINGVQQGEDDYTGTGGTGTVIGAIEGTGVISTRLPPGSATWIGAGSTDRLTDAANWDCTQQIYFKEPTLKATFASGGTQATVASDAALKGIVWNSGVSSFTLMALTGSECLQLGSAGFAAAANGSGKYNPFTVGVPVAPAADQEWSVPEGLTLTVSAPFRNVDAVPSTACVTKLGAGRLDLKSAASTFSGSFYLKEGVTYASGNEPFGAGGGTVRVKARDWNGRRLHLSNVTMSNPVTLEDNYSDRCTLRSMAGTTNVLKGLVTSTSCSALAVEAGSRLVFEGGYGTENARSYVNWICDGEVVVTNRPFIVGEYAPNSMNLHFWNAGNSIAIMNSNKGAIHIHQDYAFTINNCASFGCALHLHGCRFAFFDNAHLKAGGKVYSDRPGGEVQVGSSGEASQTDFMDDVSLVKKDSGTFTVGSAVSSTGVVTVTEGKLAFNADGSWKKAASVVVSGGTLEIAHTRVFTKATDLSLSGNGVLSFADGVDGVLRVGWIVLDGTQMPLGRYCAEGNTAAPADVRRTSHIVGNGIVEACGRKLGMALIVR